MSYREVILSKYGDMQKYLLAHNLSTNNFGNAQFFARVEYHSPSHHCVVQTLVCFVLVGYCEGTVRLDPSEGLTSEHFIMNFTCAWYHCSFDEELNHFVIKGEDQEKLGGEFKVVISQS